MARTGCASSTVTWLQSGSADISGPEECDAINGPSMLEVSLCKRPLLSRMLLIVQ
jgi:hypothetical protein